MVNYFLKFTIRINNFLLKMKREKIDAQDMIILLPRCLQNSDCTQNIVKDSSNCKQCGRCHICDIVSLGKTYGLRVLIATGGHMARDYVRQYKPRLIIAVACENELLDGMFKVFPKSVYAVANSRPNGPCKDTCVDKNKVEDAIQFFKK